MVTFKVTNYGKTPAILLKLYGEFSEHERKGNPIYLQGENKILRDIVIEAHSHVEWTAGFPYSFHSGEMQESIFFFGYIEYLDIFRIKRTSRYSIKIIHKHKMFIYSGEPAWNDWD
jgi:intein/homing endonuclease